MQRSLLTIVAVAALAALIARIERATGDVPAPPRTAPRGEWIRTADGWQRRSVLTLEPPAAGEPLHPGLVAAFQLAFSLLVLMALPGNAHPAPPRTEAIPGPARRHPLRRASDRVAGVA
ncbi:MAG TPA: hypothetical protein VEQ85_00455 [Lacipirellulaceae bacterium]|nr:hypothetical protein [Lacipirellulaceae bacterium]